MLFNLTIMGQEPKRRHSRARKGKRRAGIVLSIPNAIVCPNCGSMTMPHVVCKNCGYYKGKEVIAQKTKQTQTETA